MRSRARARSRSRCSSPRWCRSLTTSLIVALAGARDDRLLRRRADRGLPVRHQVDAAAARRPAVLRRHPAHLGHALPDRASACSSRSRSGCCARSTSRSTRARASARSSSRSSRCWPASRRSSSATSRSPSSRPRSCARCSASTSTSSTRCRPGSSSACSSLPTIASVAEDAMSAVPASLREGAFGLGANKLQVSLRVVFPAALSGIVAALVLGASRAVGETVIILIAGGQRARLGVDPTRVLPVDGGVHRRDVARRHPDGLDRVRDDLRRRLHAVRDDARCSTRCRSGSSASTGRCTNDRRADRRRARRQGSVIPSATGAAARFAGARSGRCCSSRSASASSRSASLLYDVVADGVPQALDRTSSPSSRRASSRRTPASSRRSSARST